ncbi:MAG: hypothetical protein II611_08035, partial [Treponema sp.]|nr:hypothetical protein [Treponema sp.]
EQYSGITAATFPLNCKQAAPWRARYLLAKAAGEFFLGKLRLKNCMDAISDTRHSNRGWALFAENSPTKIALKIPSGDL